jgi:tRNA threonylcarbamoyladenosine biosynthesis protein TsaB
METEYSFAPAHLNKQRAGAVGVRAFDCWAQGKYVTADVFEPNYLRLSQAERERMEKEKAGSTGAK